MLMDSLLFQNGELSLQDFRFVVAHPDILPELVSIRGLMKRKFPNQKSGTLKQGKEWNTVMSDVHTVKLTFRHWAFYTCKKGIPLPLSNCILCIQSTNILTEFFETCCTISVSPSKMPRISQCYHFWFKRCSHFTYRIH